MLNLEKEYPHCKGAGLVTSPEWEEWNKQINAAQEELGKAPDIDWIDKNLPMPEDTPEEILCDECEGRGTIPTEEGMQMLTFLRKWI